jgi:exosortase/archaeosortase family protein
MEYEVGPRKSYLPQLLSKLSKKAHGEARAQIAGRVALSIVAVAVDVRVVPELYSARPFFALGAFAVLALISSESRKQESALPPLARGKLAAFVCLHLLLITVAYHLAGTLLSVAHAYSLQASILSGARIVVVLPTLLLFPLETKFYRRFRSELIAATIVLLVFFPDRYFQLIWPWYSRVLTTGTAFLSRIFVPGTHVVESPVLAVVGPSIDMVVDLSCSGIIGMNLFHLLFGIVVAVEWNRLNKARALICFVLGGVAYVVANFLRLNLLFLIGNLVSSKINLDFLGWVIFGITFYLLMKISYDWMVIPERVSEDLLPNALQKTA